MVLSSMSIEEEIHAELEKALGFRLPKVSSSNDTAADHNSSGPPSCSPLRRGAIEVVASCIQNLVDSDEDNNNAVVSNDMYEVKETNSSQFRKANENYTVDGDPKPKRPLSAYNIFFQIARKRYLNDDKSDRYSTEEAVEICKKRTEPQKKRQHRRTHGKVGFGDLARIIAEKWKTLDNEQRQVFNKQAEKEKEKYIVQISAWRDRHNTVKNDTPTTICRKVSLEPCSLYSSDAVATGDNYNPANNLQRYEEFQPTDYTSCDFGLSAQFDPQYSQPSLTAIGQDLNSLVPNMQFSSGSGMNAMSMDVYTRTRMAQLEQRYFQELEAFHRSPSLYPSIANTTNEMSSSMLQANAFRQMQMYQNNMLSSLPAANSIFTSNAMSSLSNMNNFQQLENLYSDNTTTTTTNTNMPYSFMLPPPYNRNN